MKVKILENSNNIVKLNKPYYLFYNKIPENSQSKLANTINLGIEKK